MPQPLAFFARRKDLRFTAAVPQRHDQQVFGQGHRSLPSGLLTGPARPGDISPTATGSAATPALSKSRGAATTDA